MFHTDVSENILTHFVFNNFFPENRAVYDTKWENMAEPNRSEVTTQNRAEKM
jgi:hypothetical protein